MCMTVFEHRLFLLSILFKIINLHDCNSNIITYEIILKRTLVFVLAVPVHQKIDL